MRAVLDLRPGRRVLSLFTNISWDSAALGHDVGFESMIEWIAATARMADRWRTPTSWCGSTRPRRVGAPTRTWRRRCASGSGACPANVRIVPAVQALNSYGLLGNHRPGAGVHDHGRPRGGEPRRPGCRWPGATHYRGRGFTYDVTGPRSKLELMRSSPSSGVDGRPARAGPALRVHVLLPRADAVRPGGPACRRWRGRPPADRRRGCAGRRPVPRHRLPAHPRRGPVRGPRRADRALMSGVLAIVQARMSSSRLPGKTLADVSGEPMLALLLRRLGGAGRIERVVVATSEEDVDDPIVPVAEQAGAGVFRGSREDVLSRFVGALGDWDGPVARLTGDCPLLDPAVVDAVADLWAARRPDRLRQQPRSALPSRRAGRGGGGGGRAARGRGRGHRSRGARARDHARSGPTRGGFRPPRWPATPSWPAFAGRSTCPRTWPSSGPPRPCWGPPGGPLRTPRSWPRSGPIPALAAQPGRAWPVATVVRR